MCWACQEGERERIWALIDVISLGQMPAGHTAEDLRNMGLPQPGELYREEQPDGTVLAAGTYHVTGTSKAGEKIDRNGGYTNTVVKEGGKWKISKSVLTNL